jgi:glutamine synthetase
MRRNCATRRGSSPTISKESKYLRGVLGDEVCEKFVELKLASADRCPRALGTRIKRSEVMFHHEVQNQYLWGQF